MILDSSAVIAISQGEPEAETFAELLLAEPCKMSVANWVEAAIVVDRRSRTHQEEFEETLRLGRVELAPVTAEQGRVAREAHRRFGRGSGSPARLNYGDCFAYALALTTGEPLLFKGTNFTHTDLRSAL